MISLAYVYRDIECTCDVHSDKGDESILWSKEEGGVEMRGSTSVAVPITLCNHVGMVPMYVCMVPVYASPAGL